MKLSLIMNQNSYAGREFLNKLHLKKINLDVIEIGNYPEIDISENEFFDYEAKYEGASQEITPAEISTELADKIQLNALKAYNLLECRGMVRVDFIVVEENRPAILEINSVPGFTKMSLLPQQLAHARINVRELLSRNRTCGS